jgi:hypothetical protein
MACGFEVKGFSQQFTTLLQKHASENKIFITL